LLTPFAEMAKQNKFKPTFKINGVSIRCPERVDKEHFFNIAAKIEEAFSTGNTQKIEHFRNIAQTKEFRYLGAVMKAKGLT